MYRIAIEKLLKWKQSKRRKPLIIEGARQVGKTWLMKEFGRQAYADTVYINFDSNSRMAELFASDLDTDRLIMGLELYIISTEQIPVFFVESKCHATWPKFAKVRTESCGDSARELT